MCNLSFDTVYEYGVIEMIAKMQLVAQILLDLCICSLPVVRSGQIWSVYSSKKLTGTTAQSKVCLCVSLWLIGAILCQNQIRRQSSIAVPSLITAQM